MLTKELPMAKRKDKPEEKRDVSLNLRLTQEEYARLEALARADHERPVGTFARIYLMEMVEKLEQAAGKK